MQYPTLEEVEMADRIQLARWYRFLPSPGRSSVGQDWKTFRHNAASQNVILQRIISRFNEMGGFTPEISKAIGWEVENAKGGRKVNEVEAGPGT
jgi:hypothetical protein